MIKKNYKKFISIINKEQTEILETAFLSMIPIILTKILGFLFGLIAATKFGNLDPDWQNFLLANAIPEFLTNVIIAGTIGSIVIPTLVSSKIKEGKEIFLDIFNTILNLCIIFLGLISLIIIVFGDSIIPLLINILSSSGDTSHADITIVIESTKILLFPQVILGISTFVSAGLNVYNRFIIPHFAPLFYNIGRLIGIVILYPMFGIQGLIYGIIIGSFFHLFIQLPQSLSIGFKYKPIIKINNLYIKEIFVVAIPRFFTLAIENLVRLISNFISYSFRGGISALYFAEQITSFVPLVFSFTFSTAAYPKMASHYEKKEFKLIAEIIIKVLNNILFLVVPIITILIILRVPISRLFFGSLPNTSLSMYETYAIAWNILLFSFGLLFVCGKWFMYRAFYAIKDTKTPLITSILSFIITLISIFLFTNLFSFNSEYSLSSTKFDINNFFSRGNSNSGVGGIPLGFSIGYFIEFFLLIYLFNKKIKLELKKHVMQFLKKLIAGVFMGIVMYLVYRIWHIFSYIIPERATADYLGSTTINLLILTFITITVSFAVYILTCILFKIEEIGLFSKYINPILKIFGIHANFPKSKI